MDQQIASYAAIFSGINEPITLNIPEGSNEVSIRVDLDDDPPSLVIRVEQEIVDPPAPTYSRTFILILADDALPANYKKYVATIPFGPGKIQTHIIETTV